MPRAKSILHGLALDMPQVAKFAGVLPDDDLQTVKQRTINSSDGRDSTRRLDLYST
ncbi:hypothetical protein ASPBRDRAFT_36466 [Aspergillus brasiliensis CBS 101740]|uniref:Uncharacterized protein n=1 Tax=Aspergillus brasiliensis (strain CBS 101740 / IMI 381727 / IBT 21946) TaxID=767769 RepID=A0A1L9V0B7_ASPBC|nr:hypothetical protein ASPBRDRAFT_36466 [Aspergillus brasiliensis CBS 101740]